MVKSSPVKRRASYRWHSATSFFNGLTMLQLTQKITTAPSADATLTLTRQQRIRSRLRVTLDDGREAGLFLPRGETLRDGDHLLSDEGVVVRIIAAPEALSSASSDQPLLHARACYHLGNRHVEIAITASTILYPQDHVLDAMLCQLGLKVTPITAPFEPEAGAYGGSAASGGHYHAFRHIDGHGHLAPNAAGDGHPHHH
jgi:urease accessory protein